jgi:hypothetical protein
MLNLKHNINKINFELKKIFENVYITEKANKNNFYVEIVCNKMFLFEGFKKRVEVKAFISKDSLNFENIKWSYAINPLKENSETIERISNIANIANDIYDVASNKRMVKEYFDNLESHVDLINEECTPGGILTLEEVRQSICDTVDSYVSKYCEKILSKEYKIHNVLVKRNHYLGGGEFEALHPTGTIEYTAHISTSNKFKLEKELIDSYFVKYVSFNENIIKVTLN